MKTITSKQRPIIFIECTNTYHSSVQTGIQRVVRNILRNAEFSGNQRNYNIEPVVYQGGQFRKVRLSKVLQDKLKEVHPSQRIYRKRQPSGKIVLSLVRPLYRAVRQVLAFMLPLPAAQRFLFAHPMHFGLAWCTLLIWRILRWMLYPRQNGLIPANPQKLDDGFGSSLDSFSDHTGNILLLLDASWSIPLWPAVERFQTVGGVTRGVIYDLIPITHGDTLARNVREEYIAWVEAHLRLSGQFIAISRTVANQLRTYLEPLAAGSTHWKVTSFYLGSELDFIDLSLPLRLQIERIFTQNVHVFIVVGSIEPRKNHTFILDAFERLWDSGSSAKLVIIGRFGWKNDDIMERIQRNSRLNDRLYLVRDMSDSELDRAYRQASALIIASKAEGFGLPIVEAFQSGLPVICSNIPIFREIANNYALFVGLDSSQNLTDVLEKFCRENDPSRRTERQPQTWLTWRESTDQLLDAVLGETCLKTPVRQALPKYLCDPCRA